MKIGYVRVSHHSQNEERQVAALKKFVAPEKIFVDKMSGKNFNRTQYQLLKNFILRDGDELFITSLDRLGRDKMQLSEELRELKLKGVTVRILDVPITLQTPPDDRIAKIYFDMMSQIMIEIMSSLAESERILIRRRQAEGIALWRRTGKTKSGRPYGRPKVQMPKNFPQMIELVDAGAITAQDARRAMRLPKTTYYRLLKEFRAKKNSPQKGA